MTAFIATLFVLSGGAALLYQVAWQRVLFSIYGINIESVSIIVTAFMLGLGIGSTLGGWVSERWPTRRLRAFVLLECALGGFGLASLPLFAFIGERTLGWPLSAIAAVTFVLLLLPTSLMGATLPLVVADAVARNQNVGQSLGLLYAVNTLGSALAAIAAALLLLGHFGLRNTVLIAVACNVLASVAVAIAIAVAASRRRVA